MVEDDKSGTVRTFADLANTEKIINVDLRTSHLERSVIAITSTLQGLGDKLVAVHQAEVRTALALENLTDILTRHMDDSNAGRKTLERQVDAIELERAREAGAAGVHASWGDKIGKPLVLALLLGLLGLAWGRLAGK